eukprot:CAMPEP_0179029468 /NCGR_PEP_ID=MMETSP0796-20121207/10071_1 /TAXON_ID=73915 /ORGANISM="Pyrodinium bahamense, Strain pbaha01" /LENGTH=336 /DNA_ID=CAMNT_0020725631 /DNA_START=239 /DNA_END=1249 /DNA_ORIENTATION=+
MCFQEVDRGSSLGELREALAPHGFDAVVQDRKDFPVVNATFFKRDRFVVSWVDHRSRVLLAGLMLPDGREVGIVNVHLEAGAGNASEAQRKAQLTSALRRARARKPWCIVACGDFNSTLRPASDLHTLLTESGLSKVPCTGSTLAVPGYADVLDHIWAGKQLRARAVLGSERTILRRLEAAGLPDTENPSDHLPVAAIFVVQQLDVPSGAHAPPMVEPPQETSNAIRREWLEILRLSAAGIAPPSGGRKRALREQKKLEAAFLATLGAEEATGLRRWHAAAKEAANRLVAETVAAALARLQQRPCGPAAGGSSQESGAKALDPGGTLWQRSRLRGA